MSLSGTVGLDAGSNLIGQIELSDGTEIIGTPTNPLSVTVSNSNTLSPLNTTTGDSGVITASFNGATQTNPGYRTAIITPIISAVSGTSPSLAIQPQWSPDGGTLWYALGNPIINISNLATSKQAALFSAGLNPSFGFVSSDLYSYVNASYPLPKTWRLKYTITGTSPSFTLDAVYINYMV